ncbi:MAG: TetR/AcrR family transcriptional regulator, partial [Streptomycetaceae bacterium]|nr:TetR/AcrR family transcriptional regulator [Streptomycetaceae bacterium]
MTSAGQPEPGAVDIQFRRRLAPAEAERRNRILDTARELVSEHGYAATTIRLIAQRAGVAPNTVYRYYASKDHLVYEVTLAWADRTTEALAARSFAGTPAERIADAFTTVLRAGTENMPLFTAGVIAFTSPETAADGMTRWRDLFTGFARIALGADAPPDVAERALVLGH